MNEILNINILRDEYDIADKLNEDLKLVTPLLSKEERFSLLKSIDHPVSFYSYATNSKYNLSEEEFNYIKRYFLKYELKFAIDLFKVKQDKFDENEKKYLLACCFENTKLCLKRLTLNIESDYYGDNCIAYQLADSLIENVTSLDIIVKLFSFTKIDLQKYLLNKFISNQEIMKTLEDNCHLFPYKSLFYKHIFYSKILDKKFIKSLILSGRFLNLDKNEKQVLHDLYYQDIYKYYIKNSKKKLLFYIKSYCEYIFESEMIDNINKAYFGKGSLSVQEVESFYCYTENIYNISESYKVANCINN